MKRDKLLRPAGTELTAYGFGVLLDFWVSELKEALKKEGLISSPAATAASGETAKDIEKRAMKKLFGGASSSSMAPEEVPLPEQDDIDQGVTFKLILKLLYFTPTSFIIPLISRLFYFFLLTVSPHYEQEEINTT